MKRYLFSGLTGVTVMMISLALAPVVKAGQVSLTNQVADLNGDGTVTIVELRLYNLAQRGDGH